MSEITLDKVDQVKERTFVTYEEAKRALEHSNGDVLEALIYIERKQKDEYEQKTINNNRTKDAETTEELKEWLKNIINKGNVTRIKIKKGERTLIDIPVNAGLAVSAIALLYPPILAVGVVATVATDLIIEITKTDGTVEIVNKIVRKAAESFKEKAKNVAGDVKDKTQEIKENIVDSRNFKHDSNINKAHKVENELNYTYTVNFDEPNK